MCQAWLPIWLCTRCRRGRVIEVHEWHPGSTRLQPARSTSLTQGEFHRLSFFLLAPGLTLVLPMASLWSLPRVAFSVPLLPIAATVVYSGSRLARIASSTRQQLIRATFWVFVYVFLGLAPLLEIASNTFPLPGTYGTSTLLRAGIIVLIGIIAFEGGYYRVLSAPHAGLVGIFARRLRPQTVVILGLASLVAAAFLLHMLGGFTHLFSPRISLHRYLGSQYASSTAELIRTIASTPVLVVTVAGLAIWFANKRQHRSRGIYWRLFILMLFTFTIVFNNPVSTPRFKVGTVLLSMLFVLPWQRWSGALVVSLSLAGLLVVFPLADLFRSSLHVNFERHFSGFSITSQLTTSGNFDAFQQVANTVYVVDQKGIQFGRQVGGALLFAVPRSAWPKKPLPTGAFVAEARGYQFTNISEPLWGEFYIDGGFVLVAVGLFFYGYAVGILDRLGRTSQRYGTATFATVIVPVFAGYQVFLLRGSLMPALAYFMAMPIVAALATVGGGRTRMRKQGNQGSDT